MHLTVLHIPMDPFRLSYQPQLQVGKRYRTIEGKAVRIIDESRADKGYECVRGSDGAWRYDRFNDVGRVTGTRFPDPRNLTTNEVEGD